MNDDEAFIRAIVGRPGDDTPRLAYADWLDERDDPRGVYLRAEREWANRPLDQAQPNAVEENRKVSKRLRRIGSPLDQVWVFRVSRPPVGVCFRRAVFEYTGPTLALDQLRAREAEFPFISAAYTAFLLNYNGGKLSNFGGDCEAFACLDCQIPDAKKKSRTKTVQKPIKLPTFDELRDQLCHPSSGSAAWGWSGDRIFTDCVPIAIKRADFDQYHFILLKQINRSRGKPREVVLFYRNPLGDDCSDMSDDEFDRFVSGFKESRYVERLATSLPDFLEDIDC